MGAGRKCNKIKNCWCTKPITERLAHFTPQLKLLNESDLKTRKELLRKAQPCLVRLLCESGLNVLKGNIKLSDCQYKKLKPHKRLLLFVSKSNVPLHLRKKEFQKKKGGFLPVVLPILLSAVSGFVGQTVARAAGLS